MKQSTLFWFLVSTICLAGCSRAREGEDKGYFLSFKQKGQLIAKGQMQDSKGNWYDVWVSPGYEGSARFGWRNIKEAGTDLRRYVEKETYTDLAEDSQDCFEWAYKDCLRDFVFKGTKKSWSNHIKHANTAWEKRAFGWWVAYPSSIILGTVETAFRIPLGLVGTAAGTVSGLAIVPAFHITSPIVQATWNGIVEGTAVPAASFAWQTLVWPPLALFGQKPAPSRVDGFWVRSVGAEPASPDVPPTGKECENLIQWGRTLRENLKEYEQKRKSLDEEYKHKYESLMKEKDEAKKNIAVQEQLRVESLQSDPNRREEIDRLRQSKWTKDRVNKYSSEIWRALERNPDGLTQKERSEIVRLLNEYPPDNSKTSEKTNPLKDSSLQVIKDSETIQIR